MCIHFSKDTNESKGKCGINFVGFCPFISLRKDHRIKVPLILYMEDSSSGNIERILYHHKMVLIDCSKKLEE